MFDKDEIIEIARQAGFLTNELKSYIISPYSFEDQDLYEELEAFAKLVAAKEREFWIEQGKVDVEEAIREEREACAQICERKDKAWKKAGLWNQSFEYKECAEAIRARGETTLRSEA